jgi:hypothetical protein
MSQSLGSRNPIRRPSQLDVSEDEKSRPFRSTPIIAAISEEVFAIGPRLSSHGEPGRTPSVEIVPAVILIEKRAARCAGCTRDPSVSLPMDRGENPAATPAPLPDEEPAGPYSEISVGRKCKDSA